MSSPQSIPGKAMGANGEPPYGTTPPRNKFLIPSPVPCRRSRTYSASERAAAGPLHKGIMKEFCRHKGHGFIIPDGGGPLMFCHISDIDGDYVPKAGDEVCYKRCPIPPKNERFSAVHVIISNPNPHETHERWDTPSPTHGTPPSGHASPRT
ncbi:unnamed protein product [Owenia fusiformis]|uniref:Uncharacterized protein n=1 Tax=Owenia fusiformis TaxID=6347 RepID=A0A8J1U991_OWEFU|nr:unnamed protein product [Owenia fusiformis]